MLLVIVLVDRSLRTTVEMREENVTPLAESTHEADRLVNVIEYTGEKLIVSKSMHLHLQLSYWVLLVVFGWSGWMEFECGCVLSRM